MNTSPGFGKHSILTAIVAVFALGPSTTTLAQDDDDALDEIIVTAQFREQRLQDAPLAITAVTDVMMQQRSIDSVWQVARFSPNVNMVPMPGPFGSSMAAFIRGIGQDDFNFAREPGVGLYIDDVYFPTLTASLFEVMDLERVEILRGPQGTLQGRNSIGGAVRMIARKPTGEGPGYAEVGIGSYSRISGRAGGEFSLSDTLSARIAGTFLAKDGYQTVLDFACYDPATAAANNITSSGIGSGSCTIGKLGGRDYAAGRAHLRWQPNDQWDISLIGDFANDDSDINANTLISAETTPNPPAAPGPQNAMPGYGNHFVPPNMFTTFETFCDDNTNPLGPTSLTGPWCTEPINHVETWGLALTVDVDINDNLSFLSITSYREFVNEWATSTDGSPIAGETGWNDASGDSFQQEFRLQGAFGDGFDYTLGLFWFEQDNRNAARIDIVYPGTAVFSPFDFITDEDFDSESLGVYAQGVFHLTDNFNITAGARYSDEEKFQVTRRKDPATGGATGSTIFAFVGCADPVTGECGRNTFKTDRVDYRVAVDYRWNDMFMTYASYATGFKSGGVSPRYFFANQFIPYDEEEAVGIEIGFKSDLADNTLRVNGAWFLNEYDDQQLGSPICPDLVPSAPCLADRNMVDAEISGFELEATWVPTDSLIVDASLAWIDNDFTRIDPNISPTFIQTSSVPEATPETKYNVGIQYSIPMASGATLTPRVDVLWQDEVNGFNETRAIGFDQTRPIAIDDYTLVNARLNWVAPDGDWEVSAALTNATDEEYFLSLFDLSSFGGWSGGMPGWPREWSLTLRRNFN
ncbi:MAG: TonB-dependent receptor [Woeseiaceae bacterium]|nr:TonB-dependent receptor [Woeseiaceae bacterium]